MGAQDAFEYVDLSIGATYTLDGHAFEYANLNVGVDLHPTSQAVEYGYFGEVTTGTPTPHLWFARPTEAEAGAAVDLIGQGLGATRETYNAIAEWSVGGDGPWTALAIGTWIHSAASGAAYGPDRTLEDVEHTIVAVTLPAGVEPPSVHLRVRTDAP